MILNTESDLQTPVVSPRENLPASLKEMFMRGIHLGYSRSSRHPKMDPFLYGVKGGLQVIDIERVQERLLAARAFLVALGETRKQILLVGSKEEARVLIQNAAESLKMPFVSLRWLGGTLTNAKEIQGRLRMMDEILEKQTSGELLKYKKKERVRIEERLKKMQLMFGGLRGLVVNPAALLVIDPKEESIAVREAMETHVPIIAIMNTDCDPTGIAYPIPGNDASRASVEYFLNVLTEGYREGLARGPQGETATEPEPVTPL